MHLDDKTVINVMFPFTMHQSVLSKSQSYVFKKI